ncbi:MAG TPA: pyruvate dehydrogenase (acetyl-transferring) E1 component subunit alpha [Limnochordia bacterium]
MLQNTPATFRTAQPARRAGAAGTGGEGALTPIIPNDTALDARPIEPETLERAGIPPHRAASVLADLYRQMCLIRRFEERAAEMYARGKIGGFLHLAIGQEPVNVGAIAALRPDDEIFTHYRDHGHALARGIPATAVMAELFGKATGCSGGRGGSMHLADAERHFWGGYAIVGAHLPLAAGMALACQEEGRGRAVLCIFGDGATNTGEFHETLNLASVWRLPVIFLCENNLYGMGTAFHRVSAVTEIYRRAAAYGVEGRRVDGTDVLAVMAAVGEAANRARAGEGPTLVEALTYRFRGHSMADPELYRKKEEVEARRRRDPIAIFRRRLQASGISGLEAIEAEVEREIDAAIRFAEESPPPSVETLCDHIYAEPIAASAEDASAWRA